MKEYIKVIGNAISNRVLALKYFPMEVITMVNMSMENRKE